MSSELVVSASGLGKCYHMYRTPQDRFKQILFPGRRYHDDFWALRDVSFEVRRGETLGIIGRNGSGKSTLLQLLSGTLQPSTGSVAVHGRVAALLELGAGFNPEFTGRENVFLNAAVLGLSHAETTARLDAILQFADIGSFVDQPVKTYSSGMYVRLAFAVIANIDADVLIIDEALSVGDAFFNQKCMRFLRRFQERGTIIFVSHDTGAVLALCERAIWLDQGSVKLEGSAKAVSEAYLKALYETAQPVNVTTPANPGAPTALVGTDHDFGTGDCVITKVELLDAQGGKLNSVQGATEVEVRITAHANHELLRPLAGFFIKDRLGQILFGDNTLGTVWHAPLPVAGGQSFRARFCFTLPGMAAGVYTVSAAVAEGSQEQHVMHHWSHDVVAFEVTASRLRAGMIDVPMRSVVLEPMDEPAPGTSS